MMGGGGVEERGGVEDGVPEDAVEKGPRRRNTKPPFHRALPLKYFLATLSLPRLQPTPLPFLPLPNPVVSAQLTSSRPVRLPDL